MCQEHQSYLGLKDVSCFKANGYAVVLFYYNLGLNFASLCLGYGNMNFMIMSSKQRE